MPATVPKHVGETPRKMLAMGLPEGEAHGKSLSVEPKAIGRIVERALEIAGMTKQEAAHLMGHAGQSTVGKWVTGLERPNFDQLLALPRFTPSLLVALAEVQGVDVKLHTTITLERKAVVA